MFRTENVLCMPPLTGRLATTLLSVSSLAVVVAVVQSEDQRTVTTSRASDVCLDGSRTSYAQFSTWSICHNASLFFEFQTRHSSALLVYAGDGRRFVTMRLVRGILQLRYRLSTTAEHDSLTTAGDGLGDGRWHAVRLRSPDGSRLVLTLDGAASRLDAGRVVRHRPGEVRLTTGTFVGGLPASVRRRPGDLAVPTVVFERRLDGSVRNFHLLQCSSSSTAGVATPAKLEAGRGMVDRTVDDQCDVDNPCLHGGICVNTAAGPLCECDRTDFDGMRCSIGLSHATFCRLFPVPIFAD